MSETAHHINQQTLPHSERTTIRRAKQRGSYDLASVIRLIEDVKLAHVALIVDNLPLVIPLTIWADNNELYIHLGNKNRIQRYLEAGHQVCISVCESKEWVLSKSAYHHSANYRCAVLYCTGERIVDATLFDASFKTCINQIEAERWQNIRPPSDKERTITALMKLTIVEGSFKMREGGPTEEPEDLLLPVANGVKPICPFHQT